MTDRPPRQVAPAHPPSYCDDPGATADADAKVATAQARASRAEQRAGHAEADQAEVDVPGPLRQLEQTERQSAAELDC